MKKHLIIAAYMICFVCCPLFAATHSNETCQASFPTNEQPQSTDWKSLGKIAAYYYNNDNTISKRIFQLYTTGTGEVIYKIKTDSTEYIVNHNPSYNPNSKSGKNSFKCIAGNYYLNLGPKFATWEFIGEITVYDIYGNKEGTSGLYIMKADEYMYRIKEGSKYYIVTPNPKYDPDSGKYKFKHVAGNYYLNLSPSVIKKD